MTVVSGNRFLKDRIVYCFTILINLWELAKIIRPHAIVFIGFAGADFKRFHQFTIRIQHNQDRYRPDMLQILCVIPDLIAFQLDQWRR